MSDKLEIQHGRYRMVVEIDNWAGVANGTDKVGFLEVGEQSSMSSRIERATGIMLSKENLSELINFLKPFGDAELDRMSSGGQADPPINLHKRLELYGERPEDLT